MKMMPMCQCRRGSRESAAAMVGTHILMLAILLPVPTSLLGVLLLVPTGQYRMDIPEGAVALPGHAWLAVGKRKSWRLVVVLAKVVRKLRKRCLVSVPRGILDDVADADNLYHRGIDIRSLPVPLAALLEVVQQE